MNIMKKIFLGFQFALLMAVAVTGLFSACSNDDEGPVKPEDITLPEAQITDTTELIYAVGDMPYYRVNFTYPSVGTDGKTPTTLSAAIVLGEDIFKRELKYESKATTNTYDAKGIILSCHFTITSNDEAPTMTKNMQIEGMMTTLGAREWIVVAPDYSGFGITAKEPQSYVQADITARQCLDALASAKKLLQAKSYNYGPRQALLGYSQGGHTAMAIQRYLSKTGSGQLFDLTCAGGGPYDISAMVNSQVREGATTHYPIAIGLMLVGVNESQQLGLDYSKALKKPFDTKLPAWLNSKKLTTDDLNDSIYRLLDSNKEKGVLVSDIINLSYVNPDNAVMKPFYQNAADNSLVSNWKPLSSGNFYLYHSVDDEVVPYFCFEHLNSFLAAQGVDDSRVKTMDTTGEHTASAPFFLITALAELKELE